MTIDEAIKKLNHLADPTYFLISTDERNALKLGIEALKVVREFRTGRYKTINSPLPGETEE